LNAASFFIICSANAAVSSLRLPFLPLLDRFEEDPLLPIIERLFH